MLTLLLVAAVVSGVTGVALKAASLVVRHPISARSSVMSFIDEPGSAVGIFLFDCTNGPILWILLRIAANQHLLELLGELQSPIAEGGVVGVAGAVAIQAVMVNAKVGDYLGSFFAEYSIDGRGKTKPLKEAQGIGILGAFRARLFANIHARAAKYIEIESAEDRKLIDELISGLREALPERSTYGTRLVRAANLITVLNQMDNCVPQEVVDPARRLLERPDPLDFVEQCVALAEALRDEEFCGPVRHLLVEDR